jgi:hypothetical protein
MDHNFHDHSCAGGNTAIRPADGFWEPWLSMWRTGALLLVEPWDNTIRVFTERAQLLPRRMAALELDPNLLARVKPFTVAELVERCTTCEAPSNASGTCWKIRPALHGKPIVPMRQH